MKRGYYQKFVVLDAETGAVRDGRWFSIDIDRDPHARAALLAYAAAIESDNPTLAYDLRGMFL